MLHAGGAGAKDEISITRISAGMISTLSSSMVGGAFDGHVGTLVEANGPPRATQGFLVTAFFVWGTPSLAAALFLAFFKASSENLQFVESRVKNLAKTTADKWKRHISKTY